jgi:hypothetical protein
MIEVPGECHGVLALLQAVIRISEVPQGVRPEDATRHRWIVAVMGARKLPVPSRIVESSSSLSSFISMVSSRVGR